MVESVLLAPTTADLDNVPDSRLEVNPHLVLKLCECQDVLTIIAATVVTHQCRMMYPHQLVCMYRNQVLVIDTLDTYDIDMHAVALDHQGVVEYCIDTRTLDRYDTTLMCRVLLCWCQASDVSSSTRRNIGTIRWWLRVE